MSLLSRYLPGTLAAVALALGVLATPALADSCPNAQYRTGPSAGLPDCRAYEQVSPVDKGDAQVNGDQTAILGTAQQVFAGGDGLIYGATGAFPGGDTSLLESAYRATRTADGWQSKELGAPQYGGSATLIDFTSVIDVSPDASKSIVYSTAALTPGAVNGQGNLYMEDNQSGTYTLMATSSNPQFPAALVGNGAQHIITGTSSDFSKVYIVSGVHLTPDAPPSGTPVIYEWTAATGLQLASVLPDGTAATAPAFNSLPPQGLSWVSDKGALVFEDASTGQLYLRENGSTVNVSGGVAVNQDFQEAYGMTADGSEVFFLGNGGLYRDDVASGTLTNLSQTAAGSGADELYGVTSDGSVAYFSSGVVLASGAVQQQGYDNLYEWQRGANGNGTVTFIAHLPMGNQGLVLSDDGLPNGDTELSGSTVMSHNGAYWAIHTTADLTPGAVSNNNSLIYVWSSADKQLQCVSCMAGGATAGGYFGDVSEKNDGGGGNIWTSTGNVSDSGQVFFQTTEPLVPQAANGLINVYEWQNGQTHLLSDGAGANDTFFENASANGNDVFITTADPLVPQDDDQVGDSYDVRVDGGLASQQQAASTDVCASSTTCQGNVPPAPSAPSIGTVNFAGPGNVTPPAVTPAPAPATVAKVRVTRKAVSGDQFKLTVAAPAAGTLVVSGAKVAKLTRKVSKQGSYKLTVRLTAKEVAALKRLSARKRKAPVKISVKVAFQPKSGKSSAVTMTFRVKPPARAAARRGKLTRKVTKRASHKPAGHATPAAKA